MRCSSLWRIPPGGSCCSGWRPVQAPRRAFRCSSALTRQAVVKHLGTLADAGMVAKERHGREVRYRLEGAPAGRGHGVAHSPFGGMGAAPPSPQAVRRAAAMSEPGLEIKHSVLIRAPREKVWAALTTAEGFDGWWGTRGSEIDLRPGWQVVTLRWQAIGGPRRSKTTTGMAS